MEASSRDPTRARLPKLVEYPIHIPIRSAGRKLFFSIRKMFDQTQRLAQRLEAYPANLCFVDAAKLCFAAHDLRPWGVRILET